ncbi:MAG: hypothetical protein U0325_14515 [Polyangiales bacterium]
MTTIAWYGTGLLGSGFVEAALTRGTRVRVWNRTAAKTAPRGPRRRGRRRRRRRAAPTACTSASPTTPPSTPCSTRCGRPRAGVPVIDHTVSPAGAAAAPPALAAEGVGYVSAPVFMGPVLARQASGRMLCAGDPRSPTASPGPPRDDRRARRPRRRPQPPADQAGGQRDDRGRHGASPAAFALGAGAGLDTEVVQRFAAAFPFGGIVAGRGARMVAGDYDASFELAMARKDVRLMCESAGDRPLAVLPGLAQRMDALIAQGHGARDLGALSVDTLPPRAP